MLEGCWKGAGRVLVGAGRVPGASWECLLG